MSEYHFGTGYGIVPDHVVSILDKIASRHGAVFCTSSQLKRFWFSVENRGSLLDRQVASRVLADASAAGLWGDDGPTFGAAS